MAHKLIEEYVRILKGDPALTIHGPLSPLLLTFPWLTKKERKMDLFSLNRGRESYETWNDRIYRDEGREYLANYWQGKLTIKDLLRQYNDLAGRIEKLYGEFVQADLSSWAEDELVETCQRIIDIFIDLANETIYMEMVDYQLVLDVIGPSKRAVLDAVWQNATQPTFVSFEMRRLNKMIDIILEQKELAVRSATYIFTDYFGPKSPQEIATRLAEVSNDKDQARQKYQHARDEALAHKKAFDEWLAGLNEEEVRLAEYLQLIMYLRDIRKDPIAQIQAYIYFLACEFFRRADIAEQHVHNVCLFECQKGVEYLKKIKSHIEARQNGWISIMYADPIRYEIELCDFEKAVQEFHTLIEKTPIDAAEVKGQIAFKGKVVGRVRIVIDPHQIADFTDGDILVTSMTRPEFVPLMKKAGGVVTNEGGITCHAAIVSRELKIPCIIGTKIATKVLKDGDMVEVDAERGVVHVIK